MLTKTLQFDDDVLAIIRTMDWRDDGKLGVLMCGQLDRKLYKRTNKALEAMGGKWNRSKGGHVFLFDPRLQVKGLIENGALTIERDGFFETPPEVVMCMVELTWPVGHVLEPSAGLGAIADHLPIGKEHILCIEKNVQRVEELRKKGYAVQCGDFLAMTPGTFDTIFMNPPFEEGQDIDHVQHAFECLALGGTLVSVMSEGPFFRSDNNATAFREWFNQVGGESKYLPRESFRRSKTSVSARLVVIAKVADNKDDCSSSSKFCVNGENHGRSRRFH